MGVSALAGMVLLVALVSAGRRVRSPIKKMTFWLPTRMGQIVRSVAVSFADGVIALRKLAVGLIFVTSTVAIWVTEVAILDVIAASLSFEIALVEALALMLFAVFASFIPALPAQIGAFQFAVVTGGGFLGLDGPKVLAFAICWHAVIIVVNSVIGAICTAFTGTAVMVRASVNSEPDSSAATAAAVGGRTH